MTTLGPSRTKQTGYVPPTGRAFVRPADACSDCEKATSVKVGVGWKIVRIFCLVALIALPIFAHGCHGEDVDDELFARVILMR